VLKKVSANSSLANPSTTVSFSAGSCKKEDRVAITLSNRFTVGLTGSASSSLSDSSSSHAFFPCGEEKSTDWILQREH